MGFFSKIGIALGIVAGAFVMLYLHGHFFLSDVYRESTIVRVMGLNGAETLARLDNVMERPVSASMTVAIVRTEDGWKEDIGESTVSWTEVSREERDGGVVALARQGRDSVVTAMVSTWTLKVTEGKSGRWTDVAMTQRIDLPTDPVLGTWHVPLFRVVLSYTSAMESGMMSYIMQLQGRPRVGDRDSIDDVMVVDLRRDPHLEL